jgi:hypothetical protein
VDEDFGEFMGDCGEGSGSACFECDNILDSDLSFRQRDHEHPQRTLLDYYTVVSK